MHITLLFLQQFHFFSLSIGSIAISGSTYYGSGVGLIYLDDVTCNGNENNLFECTHRGIGRSNCYHHQDAAVICKNTSKRVVCFIKFFIFYFCFMKN